MKDEQITGLTVMGAMIGARHETDQALTAASMSLSSTLEGLFTAEPKEFGVLHEVLAADSLKPTATLPSSDTPSVPVNDPSSANGPASQELETAPSAAAPILDDLTPASQPNLGSSPLADFGVVEFFGTEDQAAAIEQVSFDVVDGEIRSNLSKVDDALYGDFRDFTYEIYNGLESGNKAIGGDIDQGLEQTGLPIVGDVLDPFLEFQYVDTLSAGPAQSTIAARSFVGDLNAFRADLIADLY